MISAGEFKNGVTIEVDSAVYTIIDFQHVKPGKGAAFVRAKIKNIITGGTVERTFRPSEKMPRAHIDRADMQFLYDDGTFYNLMNVESFEQITVSHADAGDAMRLVKENDMVKVLSHNGKVFGIEPPLTVELVVTETEPGFAGNTAQGATKPATVETGVTLQVPLFITEGETIKIDTRTGEYLGRA